MKNRPLNFQLWFVISLLLTGVMMTIFGVMNVSIKNFFEKQTFDTIEYSQARKLQSTQRLQGDSLDDVLEDIEIEISNTIAEHERSVNHLFLTETRLIRPITRNNYPLPLVAKVKQAILSQENSSQRYLFNASQQIYAVVTKVDIKDQQLYLISYMSETYTRGLIESMNRNIMAVLFVSLLVSTIIARVIAGAITKPLKALESQFAHIAHKEWQEDLELNRGDEIGSLAKSANLMQQTLIEKDIEEKTFIQTVSHDLKTPIMVIRSYSQAVLDGIIEPEDISNSIRLIDNEAVKMDDKIKDMIYLYTLRNQQTVYEDYNQVPAKDYLEDLAKRFQYNTSKISIEATIEAVSLSINQKSFTVAIENIVENALRFATSTIQISCAKQGSKVQIKIYNDGSSLENPKKIFERYQTESRGNTGLGMAITKEIVENHKGHIFAQNEENGVSFIIQLPV